MMRTSSGSPNAMQFQGPITLERALFCVGCEVIFTGTLHCPRCSGEAVWPLADWLRPARPSSVAPLLRLVKTPEELALQRE